MLRPGLVASLAFLAFLRTGGTAVAVDKPQAVHVLVWDEQQPRQKTAYKNFLGNAIAAYLKGRPGIEVRSTRLNDKQQGLATADLEWADVIVWWGHVRQQEISSKTAKQIVARIVDGKLALIALHSAHWSAPFMEAMNERTRRIARKRYPDPERGPKVQFEFVLPPGRSPRPAPCPIGL